MRCPEGSAFQGGGDVHCMFEIVWHKCTGVPNRPTLVALKCVVSRPPFHSIVDVCGAQLGWTALICAAWNGHTSTVALLLEKGASVDQADEVRWRCPSSCSTGVTSANVCFVSGLCFQLYWDSLHKCSLLLLGCSMTRHNSQRFYGTLDPRGDACRAHPSL